MLAMRILVTVFIGISILTGLVKNFAMLESIHEDDNHKAITITCLWSILWRVFVIVAIWVV